jgi:hypothetical protein
VLPVMARSMPWLMSMFVHVALAMIFMFIAMITVVEPVKISGSVPLVADITDSAPLSEVKLPTLPKLRSPDRSSRQGKRGEMMKMPVRNVSDRMPDDAIGLAAAMGIEPEVDPARLIGTRGDGTIFGGPGPGHGPGPGPGSSGRAPDVVYLIDRSGSMVDMFEAVRREILRSIAGMSSDDRFHVVLFSDGKPLEKLPRAMTLATDIAKVGMVKFLSPVRASGKTDPIPAINRAFDAIGKGGTGRVAVIHLLTDGVFPNNDTVMKTIRRRNASGRVRINTILYGNRPPIAEEVMSRIASENGGTYRFISRDE